MELKTIKAGSGRGQGEAERPAHPLWTLSGWVGVRRAGSCSVLTESLWPVRPGQGHPLLTRTSKVASDLTAVCDTGESLGSWYFPWKSGTFFFLCPAEGQN